MDYWQSLSLLIINDEPILNLVNNQAIILFMKAIKNNNVYWKKLQMLLSTFHQTHILQESILEQKMKENEWENFIQVRSIQFLV